MTICAVINVETNVVENVIVAEVTDIPPENTYLVAIPDNVPTGIGHTWDGSNFIDTAGNVLLPNEVI